MRSWSMTASPASLAKWLQRPVNGAVTSMPSPASALATRSEASSSCMSSGSSRAAMIDEAPAAFSLPTSSADRRRPLAKLMPFARQLCARMAPVASSIGVSPNLMHRSSRRRYFWRSERLEAAGTDFDDLAEDRDGNLGRRLGADIEADRPMDAGEHLVADADLGQPLLALGVGALAAQRADIEDVRLQRRLERRVVQLGVMRERDDRGRCVEPHRLEGLVGPILDHLDARKALRRRPGAARIDDGDVEFEHRRHRRQTLRDVHGTNDDQPWRRH